MRTMLAIAGAGLVIAGGGWADGVITVGVELRPRLSSGHQ